LFKEGKKKNGKGPSGPKKILLRDGEASNAIQERGGGGTRG